MRKFLFVLVAVVIICNLIITPCFADPLRKLGRGLANAATGVVEIPKKVILITKNDNPLLGLTWGFVKGAAVGLLRTAVGVYETVTFPIPAPADYEPMIQPEFVFEEWK
ncbi:MAG: exosortase system-associated protein, TIGR04073 family [Candidatus Omnitrophica bacterium]|nr:exosortase system-associated protein, TIGR04073 family [Candidatus Omnitrophota bacterium]